MMRPVKLAVVLGLSAAMWLVMFGVVWFVLTRW